MENTMFIQTETTPNPATLKFLPGKVVLEAGTADFPSVDSVNGASPLAEKLFAVSGVTGVFYGYDFITITKDDSLDWQHLKPSILATIMEYFMAGSPVMTSNEGGLSGDSSEEFYDEADANIVTTIKELLETRVRPAVAQDGGDITFHGYKEGKVFLHMKGACAGCPSSTATLKHGIQNLLRHFIPEVEEVEAV
jgi:Fe-S cluster biogenesis protein NfuA